MQASTIQKTMKEPLVSEHLDFPKLYNKKDMVNVVFFYLHLLPKWTKFRMYRVH